MASPIHGRSGRLYVGLASSTAAAEPVTNLNSWSIEFTVDQVETTVFGDANRTYVSGLPDAGGQFSGYYDTASAQLFTAAVDGAARRFYLYPTTSDTGEYFWGTGLFDFSVTGGIGDAVAISGNFKAASAIAKQAP